MIWYLSKQKVILINQETIKAHGGNFLPPFNLLHEENLDYLLDAVHSELFGEPMYPLLSDKAAVYLYNIVCNHIFSDGNKRNGLGAALQFLNLNGHELGSNVTNELLTDFVLTVASGSITLDACREWFRTNIVSLTIN